MTDLGAQLVEITSRLNAATDAWAAAGYPVTGPEHDAREAVFADLRDWNRRVGLAMLRLVPRKEA